MAAKFWILSCMVFSFYSVNSQTLCPELTQSEINTNCTARWYNGIENGSCSEIENDRMVYNKYLGCFSDLINVDEVGLCCSKLPMLYENSPINEKGVLFRSLPFAIRTALCGQFLYYRQTIKNETYEESSLFTLAASQNWRDLSYYLKIASYDNLKLFYDEHKTEGGKIIPRQLAIINSNAELIDSAYMDSCDYCNICENKCETKPKDVDPLGPNPTQDEIDQHNKKQKEHDLMVQNYLIRKQEACPKDWSSGIPGGRQPRTKQIENAVKNLDMQGTDQVAAQSRSNFIDAVLDSHFLSCQFKDCPCPYIIYDNFCSIQRNDIYTSLDYSLTKNVLAWKYMNCSSEQQDLFDSFFGKQGQTGLDYLKNEQLNNSTLLRLDPSDYLEFKNYELAKDLIKIMRINPDNPAQWTGQGDSSFYNLALRTSLLSVSKKLLQEGNSIQETSSMEAKIKEKDKVGLMKEMKSLGYKGEADIISYSLLPFPCAFVRSEFLVYVDEAMDDGANGELIKKYLHQQIKGLRFGDDAVRFQMATFYNTNSSDSSKHLNIISPFQSNNSQADIDQAISSIQLNPANRNLSSVAQVLLNAWDIYNQRREGVDVIVVILSDGNFHNKSEHTVDKLFNDPYWAMNYVSLNFQTIAIGVGKDVYQNWNNLFLIGRDLVLQKKSIRKLQSESDISSAVNFVNLAIERTCYNPSWQVISAQKQNLTLHEGDYKFMAYWISTLDQGLYLIMQLPKDRVEVYASLETMHPTQFDHTYQAYLRNDRDSVS